MKGRTYRYFQGKPLYPFGYGLTYGDVKVESVECGGQEWAVGRAGALEWDVAQDMTVSVRVKNEGQAATGEVVQAYVEALESDYATPNGKLCAFRRVFLNGGENGQVELTIGKDAFTVVNEEGNRIVDGGKFRVSIGLGQPDERTKELTGKECIVFTVDRR